MDVSRCELSLCPLFVQLYLDSGDKLCHMASAASSLKLTNLSLSSFFVFEKPFVTIEAPNRWSLTGK